MFFYVGTYVIGVWALSLIWSNFIILVCISMFTLQLLQGGHYCKLAINWNGIDVNCPMMYTSGLEGKIKIRCAIRICVNVAPSIELLRKTMRIFVFFFVAYN